MEKVIQTEETSKKLEGVHGWLFFFIFTYILGVINFMAQYMELGVIDPEVKLYFFIYIGIKLVVMTFFFRKSKHFPLIFLADVILDFLFVTYGYTASTVVEQNQSNAFAVGRVLWIVYFFTSQRVKNTLTQ